MKRLTVIFCSTIALAIAGCNDGATTNSAANSDSAAVKTDSPGTAAAPAAPMDSAAMMKAWMEFMTPGELHKFLAEQNGTWEGKITMWMAPGAPPSESKGQAVNRMILGGRYQEAKFTGTFDGQPFEGQSIVGYDNAKKAFVSTWVDNMGTGIMVAEGPWDAASKTITFKGTMIDPMTGKECKLREIMTFIDKNNHKMEMYNTMPGAQEYKSMEIIYTRK